MARSRRKTKHDRLQTIAVVATSIFSIASLVVAGLFIGGTLTLEMFGFDGGDGGYRNITLTDAQFACEQEARQEYDKRLRTITVDSLSSRYDQKSNRFKMYFNLDMYPNRGKNKNIAVAYYLNCFVHGSRGRVTHFESVEAKEASAKPIRESEGNIFGF